MAGIFTQFPTKRPRGVMARRRAVRQDFLAAGVAEADQVLLARRLVRRAVVPRHKETELCRDGEGFRAQDPRKLFTAGRKAGNELSGFVAIRRIALFQEPRV